MFNAKKTTTVDGILAAFTKTISELRQHGETSRAQAEQKHEQATALRHEATEHSNEAARADTVADKLQAIINS